MKTKLIIALIIILALGWYISSYNNNQAPAGSSPSISLPSYNYGQNSVSPTPSANSKTGASVSTNSNQASNGRLILGITDDAVNLDTIQSIFLSINHIEIHQPKTGWQTVSDTSRSYDLLKLHAAPRTELMADLNLPGDTYDGIRLDVENISVTKKDGSVVQAKVPSNKLELNANIKVIKGKISSATVDFLSDKSLHQTGKGEMIFMPVVSLEAKSETTLQSSPVVGSANTKVEFLGGDTTYNATFGMDENGALKVGGMIDPLATFEIVNGKIQVIPRKQ